MTVKLEYTASPKPEEEQILFDGLSEEAYKAKGLAPMEPFAFFLKDEGEVLGGIKGFSYYGCLYIDLLWITQKLRGKGWGTKLVLAAEEIAKKRMCTFITVNTMDWEASDFYKKLGYTIEYSRSGYAKNSTIHFFSKQFQ